MLIRCSDCSKYFSNTGFKIHVGRLHKEWTRLVFPMPLTNEEEERLCEKCDKIFDNVGSLKDHIRITHNKLS